MAQQIECVVTANINQLDYTHREMERHPQIQIPVNQLCSEEQGAKNKLQNRCHSSPEERTKEFGDGSVHLLARADICSSVCSRRIYQKLETSDSYPGCKDTTVRSQGLEWVLMRGNNPILCSHSTV